MKLNVNGADVDVDDRFAGRPLLWVLRDVLGLTGTKYGRGIGFCAACTVLVAARTRATRKRIIDAAAELFAAEGYAATALEQVAARDRTPDRVLRDYALPR